MLTKATPWLFRCVVLLVLAPLLPACKTQNLFGISNTNNEAVRKIGDSVFFQIDSTYEYRVRKNDKLSISVWDHDNLSVGSIYGIYNSNEVYGKWLLVNSRGTVNIPKIGPVSVVGQTVPQLEDSLRQLLSTWIKNPIVDIKVLNREVNVIGEIKKPGPLLLEKENYTLMEILSKAGDFDFYANKKKITIIRTIKLTPYTLTLDLTKPNDYALQNIQILPGDLIYVPSKKGKDFDRRISTVIPFASIVTAFAIGFGTFF